MGLPSIARAFGIGAVVALLSACGSSQPPLEAGSPARSSDAQMHGDRGSWMLPEAQAEDLLYATDGTGDVDAFSFPGFKLIGKLTGFAELTGVCADARGNVWVPNDARSTIQEFAHGGTVPIVTLSDPGQYMITCSVDPLTDDLAVSTLPISGGPPSIAIYAKSSSRPNVYTVPDVTTLGFITYGPRSQLFFDGMTAANTFEMLRFSKGLFTRVQIRGSNHIYAAGGAQYAEGALTINIRGSGNTSLIRQMSTSGIIKGTTNLMNSYSCQGYLIWQKIVLCPSGFFDLRVYAYPEGGNYETRIPLKYFGTQVAMSVSPSRKK